MKSLRSFGVRASASASEVLILFSLFTVFFPTTAVLSCFVVDSQAFIKGQINPSRAGEEADGIRS